MTLFQKNSLVFKSRGLALFYLSLRNSNEMPSGMASRHSNNNNICSLVYDRRPCNSIIIMPSNTSNNNNKKQDNKETSSPAPSVLSPPTTVETYAPTVSNFPTITALPKFEEICFVCREGSRVANPNQTVDFSDRVFTCEGIETAGSKGLIAPDECCDYSKTLRDGCECDESHETDMPSKSPSLSASPTMIATFAPTSSSEPTIPNAPKFSQKCHACGDEGREISNRTQAASFEGYMYT